VLVAKQVEAGLEVLVGMSRDPDYGPVLAVGAGGGAVEELDHVSLCTAPVDLATAHWLATEAGVEDASGVVAGTLVALSRLALAYPQIESIDVNPLIVGPESTVAVDALIVIAT